MELKFSDIAKRVNKEIKDDNLKEFLFGSSEPDGDDLNGIGILYRMLLFTFFCAFSKYKSDKRNKNLDTDFPNALRVFDSFECIYNGEDISFDLIIYVLTEIQIDVITNRDSSYFYPFFSSNEHSLQIPSLRRAIKTWLHSAKLAEQNNKVVLGWFVGLYDALDILRNVQLKPNELPQNEDDIWYNKQKYNYLFSSNDFDNPEVIEVSNYELMFIDQEDNELYYLGSYENLPNDHSLLSYYTLDGGNVQKLEVPTQSFLNSSFTTNNNSIPKSIFAKSLFSIGFKYIKNLSFAICDIMTNETKQILYEHFSQQYPDIFETGFNKQWYELNWDNILTILMFEEGPSEILELILDSNGMYFEKILKNLEMRYNVKGFVKNIKTVYENDQKKEMDMVRRYVDDRTTLVNNIKAINKTLMARSIIDGLAKLEHNDTYSKTQFVESLPMRINSIKKLTLSNETMVGQTIKINKALEKTFRFIIPFYYGIVAYQRYKDNAIIENEANGKSDFDRNALFARCEEEFFDAAIKKTLEIYNKSLGVLVEEFRNFAGLLRKSEGKRQVVTDDGKALKAAIGRDYLCTLRTFNKILTIKYNVYSDGEVKKKETDIVGFINDVKHDKGNKTNSFMIFKEFVRSVKELLYYFIYNEDYEREMVLGQQISYDSIYPYVVRYTEKSENRDGYHINSFSIFFDADNGEKEVKILSDREYEINEKYYCIPNVTMSNSRWWIEPFLISCRKYDDRINKAVENARNNTKRDEDDDIDEDED